jgi:hypothetical protein
VRRTQLSRELSHGILEEKVEEAWKQEKHEERGYDMLQGGMAHGELRMLPQ